MVLQRDIKRPIILASGSPRRSQILSMLGMAFEVAKSGVADEDAYINMNDLDGSLRRLAEAKAESASAQNPQALVLGADTVVVMGMNDGVEVLGKPADRGDAARMLRKLSGAGHTVITSVSLRSAEINFCESTTARTAVFFRDLGDDEIEYYLSLPEYKDKAGSYAVQGVGMTFIERIEGCYYNVMGLPVAATLGLFKEFIRKETAYVGK